MLSNAPRMFIDLRCEGVLLLRHVAELFDQRQIAVAFNIALGAGITIPVPGAAEIATGFDDVNIGDAGLMEARTGEQSAETSADDYDVDVSFERFPGLGLHVRIVEVMCEFAGHLDILG